MAAFNSRAGARWIWGARWPDGTWQVIATDKRRALERRGLAQRLTRGKRQFGGPTKILYGPVPRGMTETAAKAVAERQLFGRGRRPNARRRRARMAPVGRIPESWLVGRAMAREREGHDPRTAVHLAVLDWHEQARLERRFRRGR